MVRQDIASCGDTPEEAVANLNDALELYINTLKEEGELEPVLKDGTTRLTGRVG